VHSFGNARLVEPVVTNWLVTAIGTWGYTPVRTTGVLVSCSDRFLSVLLCCNVAGVLENYVQTLEKQRKFDLLRNLYASVNGRSIDDAQMVEFFKMKFWM